MSRYFQYYVEGDDEKKLVEVLKRDMCAVLPGKIQRLNVIQERITNAHLIPLKTGTVVVLIFDTDTKNIGILNKNIKMLNECKAITDIVLIPQVPNLEGELVSSCDIKKITELLGSHTKEEFKRDFIHTSNLADKLREHKFDLKVFWSKQPPADYKNIRNDAEKIKVYG